MATSPQPPFAAFGCGEDPFAPADEDGRFYFEYAAARKACAALVRSLLERGGIAVLCGAPGVGKSLVLHHLTDARHQRIRTAYLGARDEDFEALRGRVAELFELLPPGGPNDAHTFNTSLLTRNKKGETLVVALDDAQQLPEAVRPRLGELAPRDPADDGHVLQLVMAAPAELAETLAGEAPGPLAEGPAPVIRLEGLAPDEVGDFVAHRLSVAGCERPEVFTPAAVEAVKARTDGNPREIVTLCDRALRLAERAGHAQIEEHHVERAARELSRGVAVGAAPPPAAPEQEEVARQAAVRARESVGDAERVARLSGAKRLAGSVFGEAERARSDAERADADGDWSRATLGYVTARKLYAEAGARALRRVGLPIAGAALGAVALVFGLPAALRLPATLLLIVGGLILGMPFADARRRRATSRASNEKDR